MLGNMCQLNRNKEKTLRFISGSVILQLVQLHQHAAAELGMDEGVLLPIRGSARLLVDQAHPLLPELGEHPLNVVHLQAQVMHALPALREIFCDARESSVVGITSSTSAPASGRNATCDFSAGTSRSSCNGMPSASRQKDRDFSISSTTTATWLMALISGII